jgi:predicted CopG family antitoxin
MLVNCIKCIKKEEDPYYHFIKQFLSLEYKKKSSEIFENQSLHIFDRLLFLRRFRTKDFNELLRNFLEKKRKDLCLEAIIFLFREKELVREILESFLCKFN